MEEAEIGYQGSLFQVYSEESAVRIWENQIITDGWPPAVLDMSPSTTTKGAERFTAPSAPTLLWGPVLAPNKINKQSQRDVNRS